MDDVDPGSRQRFRGAILGTAVGDALGAPFEGHADVDAAALERWAAGSRQLRWTDDTAMTIGLAESLVARGGFDGADMAQRFADHHAAEPWRGYGGAPPQIFAQIRAGAPWDEPARQLFGGRGSFGNGAAMRVAPAGLLHQGDPQAAAALARRTAAITHTHELAVQGAALQAAAVAWCATSDPTPGAWSAAALIAELRRAAPAPEYQRALDDVAELQDRRERGEPPAPREVTTRIGTGVAAVEAVPAALHALLAHPRSLADAVRYAIGLGGDTDTVAAMAGALAGALLGEGAVPEAWRSRLEAHDRLVALADRLWGAAERELSGPGGRRAPSDR